MGDLTLSVVIVEDEPLAQQRLVRYVEADSRLRLIGTAADVPTAVRLIDELRPDLLLLDVELPGQPGHEAVVQAGCQPMVIYTTAYAEHAVTAFELGAVDYLVKPFGARRFSAAIERAFRLARSSMTPTAHHVDRIFATLGAETLPVRVSDIVRFEAAGDYVRVHARSAHYLAATSIAELMQRLDPQSFLRVHRLHVVNIDHVRSIRQYDGRRMLLRMADGTEIVASRSGSQALRALQRLGRD